MSTAKGTASFRILVVDDEPDLRTLYELTLLREGYQIDSASCLAEAWAQLEQGTFDVVITDMRLPDGLGLEILRQLGAQQRAERCIVMTAYGSAENAVECLKAGAFDYLTKPVDLKQFRAVVASAVQRSASADRALQNRGAEPTSDQGQNALQRLVGTSEPMKAVKARIARVAQSMAPVLVYGESGTGKELVAQAVHACSHRASGPFIAVNCGAIPENLLEAEFFGARKGSYTGAAQDREGYFQAARNGTLFLDEIGDLPLVMQSKLLRAIQERSIRALGSTVEDTVDVRVVSATHKDLAAEVQAGRFRQDLYYRLNVIEIPVPPLRQRRSDLPALCKALLNKIARESGLVAPALSPHLLQQLEQHPLHGNVRELENLLHRALALNDGSALDIDSTAAPFAPLASRAPTNPTTGLAELPPAPWVPSSDATPAAPGSASAFETATALESASKSASTIASEVDEPLTIPDDLQAYLDAKEKLILIRVLQDTHFNRTAAAARLKLSLRQIRYRIERLNIALPQTDDGAPFDGTAPVSHVD